MSDKNQTQTPVTSSPFNPFVHLSVAEIVALTGRYNKAWKTARAVDIALAQTEYSCTVEEACFFADLKTTAVAIIDRETVSTMGDKLAKLVRGIGTASKEITLNLIKSDYDSVKVELQNEVGKRVRDNVYKEYEASTASRLLEELYKFLGVKEKDWMR